MASNLDLNTENDNKQELLVTIEYNNKKCKKKPAIVEDEDFYTVYSPKEVKLVPRDTYVLNLRFNNK